MSQAAEKQGRGEGYGFFFYRVDSVGIEPLILRKITLRLSRES
jgi:hypothetical protein